MKKEIYISKLLPLGIAFIGIPVLLYVLGDFPKRNFLIKSYAKTYAVFGFIIINIISTN